VYICPECGTYESAECFDVCPDCDNEIDENEWDFLDPICFKFEDENVKAFDDEYGDIFIEKSNYYTYAQFCSPCAPGACYLTNPLEEPVADNKCYCFGPDWFESDPPYPIYEFDKKE